MKREFDYIVYIGRFQPFHDGHVTTLNLALEQADKVIIIIGSANSAPTPKNPWTAEQRRDMIIEAMAGNDRLYDINFVFAEDRLYKEPKWFTFVEGAVKSLAGNGKIGLIGHEKDATSYYLKNRFPRWKFVETGPYIKERGNSAAVVLHQSTRANVHQSSWLHQEQPATGRVRRSGVFYIDPAVRVATAGIRPPDSTGEDIRASAARYELPDC